jgi:hypothetical protein
MHNRPFLPGGAKQGINGEFDYTLSAGATAPNFQITGFRGGYLKGRNMTIGQGKRGSTMPGGTFGRYPEHLPEPFERGDDLRRVERNKQNGKIVGAPAFRSMTRGDKLFTNPGEFCDTTIPPGSLRPNSNTLDIRAGKGLKPFLTTSLETKYMGGKAGIGRYPEHPPDPFEDPNAKHVRRHTDEKPWYYTYNHRSKPCPPI